MRLNSSDDLLTMLRHADAAMYKAKRRGDTIASYDYKTDRDAPEALQLLAYFREP